MKIIKQNWTELTLYEKEHPAKPGEIYVCGTCQTGWPPYAVSRAKGKKNPIDHETIGLFWEWDTAVAFAKIAEEMGL